MTGPPLIQSESGATIDPAFGFQSATYRPLGGHFHAERPDRRAQDEAVHEIAGDWPGDADRRLAETNPHGRWIRWQATEKEQP